MPGAAAMNVRVRWMNHADVAGCMRIERASFRHPLTVREFHDTRNPPGAVGHVVETLAEEVVLGYLVYQTCPTAIEVVNLAIDPEFRRLGLGRMLVDKMVSGLRADKRRRASATVDERNIVAQQFFRAVGWRATRMVRRPWPDCCDDDGIRFTRWHDQEAVDAHVLNAIARGGFSGG